MDDEVAIRAMHRARGLTVGKLRQMLEGLPDDMPVMTPSTDHRYTGARAGVLELREQLVENRGASYCAHYAGPLEEGEVVFKALVTGWELF